MRPAPQNRSSHPAPPARRGVRLLVLAATFLGLLLALSLTRRAPPRPAAGPSPASSPPATSAPPTRGAALDASELVLFSSLEAAEREADSTVWAPERRAQARATLVEELWNRLRTSPDALRTLAEAPFISLAHAPPGPPEVLAHGILLHRRVEQRVPPAGADWRTTLSNLRDSGWQLDHSEWRHVRFMPATATHPDSSWFNVRLDLSRGGSKSPARAQIQARVRFTWSGEPGTPDASASLGVEAWEAVTREGPPPFRPILTRELEPFPRTTWIDPILVRDLDQDGIPEVLLAARNLMLRRAPDGTWSEHPLTPHHPGLIFTALLADFSGDGVPDLLCAVRSGLVLLRGSPDGGFPSPSFQAWTAPNRLEYAQALTCGDIDGDGDLDVFLGQYRTPYVGGQMPQPYFDANDGPPSYLLRNDGTGHFTDVTAGSGLEAHRHRRTYGASLVDLDADGDLDVLVTSDFAGMEAHVNDGKGWFAPPSPKDWFRGARGFGMSHTLQDFNGDGQLDVLFVAMPQPTAERLNLLRLERPGFEDWRDRRPQMTVGNRLYLGTPGGFTPAPSTPPLAQTGWAWSAAAFDLDHDRLPDLHVVNGHETRETVRDYETEFWTHDIYLPPSTPPRVAEALFAARFANTRGRGWSYGGNDLNRLLLNLSGKFLEVGHLFGVALPEDSRNVVAEDFDGDGDEDLLVTTFEVWPRVRQTVRLFENRLETRGHWVGFRLPEGTGIPSPIGVVVRVRDAQGSQVRTVTTGDGYRSQSDARVRFGLGTVTWVDEVEVRYPGRAPYAFVPPPAVDTIHRIPPPPRSGGDVPAPSPPRFP